jgi:Xaa-Pro aminopeptidase
MTGTKKSGTSSRWGYGWGLGKKKQFGDEEMPSDMLDPVPEYIAAQSQPTVSRSNTRSTQNTQNSQNTVVSKSSMATHVTGSSHQTKASYDSAISKESGLSKSSSKRSKASKGSYDERLTLPRDKNRRPTLNSNDSSATLVGSALERKINDVESFRERVDTGPRLAALRQHMEKDKLDY